MRCRTAAPAWRHRRTGMRWRSARPRTARPSTAVVPVSVAAWPVPRLPRRAPPAAVGRSRSVERPRTAPPSTPESGPASHPPRSAVAAAPPAPRPPASAGRRSSPPRSPPPPWPRKSPPASARIPYGVRPKTSLIPTARIWICQQNPGRLNPTASLPNSRRGAVTASIASKTGDESPIPVSQFWGAVQAARLALDLSNQAFRILPFVGSGHQHDSVHLLLCVCRRDGARAARTMSRQAGTAQVAPRASRGVYMAPQ